MLARLSCFNRDRFSEGPFLISNDRCVRLDDGGIPCITSQPVGGRRSMVDPQIVILVVAGSSPVGHPTLLRANYSEPTAQGLLLQSRCCLSAIVVSTRSLFYRGRCLSAVDCFPSAIASLRESPVGHRTEVLAPRGTIGPYLHGPIG